MATIEAVVERKSIDEVNRKEILELIRRNRALDAAREVAEKYARQAHQSLESLPESSTKDALLALADYVVDRNR
jgi:all-trans-nonaprenyl-diphosphate synthase